MASIVRRTTTTTTRLDTNILGNSNVDGVTELRPGFDQASTKTAGLIKGVNIFYRILLTEKGSNPLNKEEGTEFPTLFNSSVSDEEVLFTWVTEMKDDALAQVQSMQAVSNAPNEERIVAVNIVTFDLDQATMRLDVAFDIYNALGQSTAVEIPSVVIT